MVWKVQLLILTGIKENFDIYIKIFKDLNNFKIKLIY